MIWWILLALAVIPFTNLKVAGFIMSRVAVLIVGIGLVIYALVSFANLSLGEKFIVTGLIGLAYFSVRNYFQQKRG